MPDRFDRLIPTQLRRFAAVGALGFIVDAGVLLALTQWFGFGPATGRVVSFAIAVVATWAANRLWTFNSGEASPSGEFARYLSVQLIGVTVNYLVYSAIILRIGVDPSGLLGAIACGSAAGLGVNYLGARMFVFRRTA
jgi:putative flippase GtrA